MVANFATLKTIQMEDFVNKLKVISRHFVGMSLVSFLLLAVAFAIMLALDTLRTEVAMECLAYPNTVNAETCAMDYIEDSSLFIELFPGIWDKVVIEDNVSVHDPLLGLTSFESVLPAECSLTMQKVYCLSDGKDQYNIGEGIECEYGACEFRLALIRTFVGNEHGEVVPAIGIIVYTNRIVSKDGVTYTYDHFGNASLETELIHQNEKLFLREAPLPSTPRMLLILGNK